MQHSKHVYELKKKYKQKIKDNSHTMFWRSTRNSFSQNVFTPEIHKKNMYEI
jgi:hypothetical protein